ncbi:MAG: right-handed parallel beta-helix repeat-containing protein [Lachnospiraceae bacterium]|nr:right-handed parallel beta-helix repeat-containing protein [Lachnospiraceae bacterium]
MKLYNKIYHVSQYGSDFNEGSENAPFKTINTAAKMARSGDMVIVHEGVYREWVKPVLGGTSNNERITYSAADGEKVVIKGSEVIKDWTYERDGVWKTVIPNSFFGEYNPYSDVIYGDWYDNNGGTYHTGEVYINGKSLYEVCDDNALYNPAPAKDAVDKEGSLYVWTCEVDEENTTIWANFHKYDPNQELVEINVRKKCFFPEHIGINYITVKGFEMCHGATQWAPPTAEQEGIIGPNWSYNWIIENNIIHDSKCVGISLGKERGSGHNFGVSISRKAGFNYQLEAMFKGLQKGWSKGNVGSHIVRNNTIYNCEQAGIVGHMGCAFSEIYGNHIYNIHTKCLFTGAEMAGIKFHAAIDTIIRNNRIHNCSLAIWLDWQNQGARISCNLFYNNSKDLMMEVCHGPCLIDNNLFLSGNTSLQLMQQGAAFVHNYITGTVVVEKCLNRATPYHFPHSTAVMGTENIYCGDDRYYNNIFVSPLGVQQSLIEKRPDKGVTEAMGTGGPKGQFGLMEYDEYSTSDEQYFEQVDSHVDKYYKKALYAPHLAAKQPIYCAGNLYCHGADTPKEEAHSMVCMDYNPDVQIEERGSEVYLKIRVSPIIAEVETDIVDTERLGMTRISEMLYEDTLGNPVTLDTDFQGAARNTEKPRVGPIENLSVGENIIRVW